MEDFRLKVFETVARLGSFSLAARSLGISQPAVSQNIAELESYAGVPLLLRSRSGVSLTGRGKEFLDKGRAVLGAYEELDKLFANPDTMLLKGVMLENGKRANVLISKGFFADLDCPGDTPAQRVIDCSSLALLPSLFNTHTHAAMCLLRGYADDLPLKTWLEDHIWPYEDKLTPADIREGSRMALREMLCSGTSFFNDMYFDVEQTIREVQDAGLRAAIGITVMENHTKAQEEQKKEFVRSFKDPTGRIQLVMAPHAIYTVGKEKLRRTADFARRNSLRLHIHLSETLQEVQDCYKAHGMSPVQYLDSIGFLGEDVIAAHCVHVDKKDWKTLASRKVTVSHCPCSNMKLGSGRFPYELALDSGCRITLGTDGASSNNNLDLREEMKFAALLAKVEGEPTLLPAREVLKWASRNGASAFGIDAGEIQKGKKADAVLLDLDNPRMTPWHNLVSNYVYSADSSCVKAVLCEGRIIYSRL